VLRVLQLLLSIFWEKIDPQPVSSISLKARGLRSRQSAFFQIALPYCDAPGF
jgi:hypothetical protein